MLTHVFYSIVLVFATVFVHAGCTTAWLHWLGRVEAEHWVMRTPLRRATLLAAVVFLMTVAAVLESGFWALLYWAVGALPSMADALYFSLVDSAPRVDPARVRPRDLDDVRPGGLGTHFIQTVMDEAEFLEPPSGVGNLLRMVRRID